MFYLIRLSNPLNKRSIKYIATVKTNTMTITRDSFKDNLSFFRPAYFAPFCFYAFKICFNSFYCSVHFNYILYFKVKTRALKDSNPRHPVLETDVLPTELRTLSGEIPRLFLPPMNFTIVPFTTADV